MLTLAGNAKDVTLRALPQTMLGPFLEQRFELTGDREAVSGAVAAAREAVKMLPPGHCIEQLCLTNLGSALFLSHGQMGARADLDEAIETLRRASPNGTARTLSLLGAAYQSRYRLDGIPADLNEAVHWAGAAVTQTTADDASATDWMGNLGTALQLRYEHAGSPADLDEAVRWLREAAERTPADDASRARACSSLGGALLDSTGEPTPRRNSTRRSAPCGKRSHAQARKPLATLSSGRGLASR
jgi:TPR repeat protein